MYCACREQVLACISVPMDVQVHAPIGIFSSIPTIHPFPPSLPSLPSPHYPLQV